MRIFWTDGSADPNPGPGGYAVLEEIGDTATPVALGGEPNSTNIRMEGSALLAAINEAAGEECEIHTDSQFWVNVLTKWAPNWKMRGWRTSTGSVKNLDLVKPLFELYEQGNVELIWVRGHCGTEFNELADQWANRARRGARV